MKKLILSVLALSLVSQTGFAGDRNRPQPQNSLGIQEFFCALAGGTAAGVIVHKAGASDPLTFIGALIGGTIGYKFCQYLNDDVAQGLQRAAWTGLEGNWCSQVKWSGGDYHGTLEVLAESYSLSGNGEAGGDNTCKQFETTIYQGRKFIRKATAWACKNAQNQWNVTDERWVAEKGIKSCRHAQPQPVVQPTPINTGVIRGFWDLERFRRRIVDFGETRGLKLAVRTQYEGEVEVGIMKALSDDGKGVIVYMSPNYQTVANIDQVGIECRHSQLCPDAMVVSDDGMFGTFQYVFRNGDAVINDTRRGIKLRPGHSVRFAPEQNNDNRAPKLR